MDEKTLDHLPALCYSLSTMNGGTMEHGGELRELTEADFDGEWT